MDNLLDVRARADLVVVLHVAAHDPTLIGCVLQPMNKFITGAFELAFLGSGRHAGEDQNRRPIARGIVHGAAQSLGAAIDVHQHCLRPGR